MDFEFEKKKNQFFFSQTKSEQSYEKKKSAFQNFQQFFFFSEFKILSFRQKESDNHKIDRQYTLGSKLRIRRRNCHKNQTFVDF